MIGSFVMGLISGFSIALLVFMWHQANTKINLAIKLAETEVLNKLTKWLRSPDGILAAGDQQWSAQQIANWIDTHAKDIK